MRRCAAQSICCFIFKTNTSDLIKACLFSLETSTERSDWEPEVWNSHTPPAVIRHANFKKVKNDANWIFYTSKTVKASERTPEINLTADDGTRRSLFWADSGVCVWCSANCFSLRNNRGRPLATVTELSNLANSFPLILKSEAISQFHLLGQTYNNSGKAHKAANGANSWQKEQAPSQLSLYNDVWPGNLFRSLFPVRKQRLHVNMRGNRS